MKLAYKKIICEVKFCTEVLTLLKTASMTKWVSDWMALLLPDNEPIKDQNIIFAAFILNLKRPKESRKKSDEAVKEIDDSVEHFIPAEIENERKVVKQKVEDLESVKSNKFVRRFRKTQRPVRT